MHDATAAPVEVEPAQPPAPNTATRWLVIANPAAGRAGPNSRAWRRLERALREAGVAFDVEWTRTGGDGARIAAAARSRGQHRFLVAGGDGSLHDVVNGLLREGDAADQEGARAVPTVVPLALGTGNDWSRSLALPRDPVALAAVIRRDAAVPHDAGRIDLLAGSGGVRETRWFINVAGAGFDAHVIERMPARTPSRLSYLLGALRELARYRSPLFRLRLEQTGDGDVIRTEELQGRRLLTFVANGRYCGGGMHVAPTALLDDGQFDVVTIAALNLWQALPRLARLYSGSLLQDSAVQRRVAVRVRIDAEPPSGIEADGQFVGNTPAIFSVERAVLRTLRGDQRATER